MFFKPALPVLLNESTMPLIFVPPKGLPGRHRQRVLSVCTHFRLEVIHRVPAQGRTCGEAIRLQIRTLDRFGSGA